MAGWLVGWSVLVCAFVCAFVSAFVCSFRGLFACVLSWVEILGDSLAKSTRRFRRVQTSSCQRKGRYHAVACKLVDEDPTQL